MTGTRQHLGELGRTRRSGTGPPGTSPPVRSARCSPSTCTRGRSPSSPAPPTASPWRRTSSPTSSGVSAATPGAATTGRPPGRACRSACHDPSVPAGYRTGLITWRLLRLVVADGATPDRVAALNQALRDKKATAARRAAKAIVTAGPAVTQLDLLDQLDSWPERRGRSARRAGWSVDDRLPHLAGVLPAGRTLRPSRRLRTGRSGAGERGIVLSAQQPAQEPDRDQRRAARGGAPCGWNVVFVAVEAGLICWAHFGAGVSWTAIGLGLGGRHRRSASGCSPTWPSSQHRGRSAATRPACGPTRPPAPPARASRPRTPRRGRRHPVDASPDRTVSARPSRRSGRQGRVDGELHHEQRLDAAPHPRPPSPVTGAQGRGWGPPPRSPSHPTPRRTPRAPARTSPPRSAGRPARTTRAGSPTSCTPGNAPARSGSAAGCTTSTPAPAPC